jgi:type II secretory pathway pseudopilin PulG
MRKKITCAGGFTLIELIMIIVITGIAILPIITMFIQGVRGTVDADVVATAYSLAREKMEETKQSTFGSVVNDSGTFSAPFTDYDYTVTVEYVDGNFTSSGTSSYKKVDVAVTYTSGYSLTLTTVLSNHS